MALDGRGERRIVAGEEGGDELAMLIDDHRLACFGEDLAAEDHQHVPRQTLPQRYHDVVSRGEADFAVEGQVGAVDRRPGAALHGVGHLGEDSLEALQSLWLGAVCCYGVTRRDRLQRRPHFTDSIDARLVELDDAHAAILPALEYSLRLQ